MKKNLKWILIVAAILAVGIIAYFIIKQSLREEAELSFPDTVVVYNKTDYEAEKIAKALSYYVLRIDTINIMVLNMPKHLEKVGDIDLLAYISQNTFEPHTYIIFLSSNMSQSKIKKVLSHEFIHIRQMEEGNLVQFQPDNPMILWKGDTIKFLEVPYDKRPHEVEAHKWDNRVYSDLEKIWYK